ncbi:hypothetical protein [Ignavibacterium album]|uniref:hypothetical protein n=1 Tax=Ignavibacterium album TaxID=591197 RepID=UPI0026EBF519|nr:hypothetical protein [Ignavibacterium album]
MKTLLQLLSILTFVMLGNTYSQTGWFVQTNPLGIGEQAMIGKVQFVNQSEGWIRFPGFPQRKTHGIDRN